jgi:osmotically-inducible protein OsmY
VKKTYRHSKTVLLGALFVSVYLVIFSMPASAQPQYQGQKKQGQQTGQQPQSQRPATEKPEGLRQMHSDDLTEDLLVMRLGDRRSFFSGMQVIVDQGVATLRGKVPSEAIESRALGIAWRTPGVRSVRDQLEVDQDMRKPGQPELDQAEVAKAVAQNIAGNITTAKADKDWWSDGWRVEGRDNAWNLVVEVPEPGRVVLEGELPNLDLVRRAIQLGAEVAGVKSLNSNLEVGAEFYRDDRSFPYYPYAYPLSYYPFYPHALEGRYGGNSAFVREQ